MLNQNLIQTYCAAEPLLLTEDKPQGKGKVLFTSSKRHTRFLGACLNIVIPFLDTTLSQNKSCQLILSLGRQKKNSWH